MAGSQANEKRRGGFQAGYIIKGRNSLSLWPVLTFFWYPPNAGLWPAQRESVKVSHCSRLIHFLSLDLSCLGRTIMVPAILWWWGGGAEGTGSLSWICPSNRRRQGYHLLNTDPFDEVAASSTNCQHDQIVLL
jgi:hypothetical protein